MQLVVGTRGSPLAMTQTRWVVERLERLDHRLEIAVMEIRTQGDLRADAPLSSMPRGLFAKELETALEHRRIDLAIHSFKDLPTVLPPGLTVAAITQREDPRDVLVAPGCRSLDALPPGARLGTSSPRRSVQLRAYRADLKLLPVRGNVGTRVAKAAGPDLDGVVLAAAGLRRLGLEEHVTEYLDPDICLPEAGQGALALETRADDQRAQEIAALVDDAASHATVSAEVAVLLVLGGGCTTPIAAYAELGDGQITIRGMVADASGARLLRSSASGPADQPEDVGTLLGRQLLDLGAGDIVGADQR
ncbi:MAG: hydroxymethylbilane synthase [Dehalococcoidia bacterium]